MKRTQISDSDGSLAPLPTLEASIEKMSQANEMSGTDVDGLVSVEITEMKVGDSDRADMICNFKGQQISVYIFPSPSTENGQYSNGPRYPIKD